jgi:hypothetical protein
LRFGGSCEKSSLRQEKLLYLSAALLLCGIFAGFLMAFTDSVLSSNYYLIPHIFQYLGLSFAFLGLVVLCLIIFVSAKAEYSDRSIDRSNSCGSAEAISVDTQHSEDEVVQEWSFYDTEASENTIIVEECTST